LAGIARLLSATFLPVHLPPSSPDPHRNPIGILFSFVLFVSFVFNDFGAPMPEPIPEQDEHLAHQIIGAGILCVVCGTPKNPKPAPGSERRRFPWVRACRCFQ